MSHVTRVKTQLRDEQMLKQALEELGYRIYTETQLSGYGPFGSGMSMGFFASRAGEKPVGFRRSTQGEGNYEALADWAYQKGSRKKIVNDITQKYSQLKVIRIARLKGFSVVQNKVNQKGQVEMLLRKVG